MVSRRTLVLIITAFQAGYSLNVPTPGEHDLGSIGACETAPALTYCGEVKHEIPASFATLAEIVEFYIKKSVDVDNRSQRCKQAVKRALCQQRFPACYQSQNTLKIEQDSNCREVIRNNCGEEASSLLMEGLCSNYTSALQEEGCRTLRDHSNRSGRVMQVCNLPAETTKLTDWMYHFLLLTDAQMDSTEIIQSYTQCYPELVKYQCSFGHCEGGNIKSTNTQEGCIAMLQCFASDVSEILQEVLPPCELWPSFPYMATQTESIKTSEPEKIEQPDASSSATYCTVFLTWFFTWVFVWLI